MAVALITGCSSGIGKHTALEMARRGYRVFATMRNLEGASHLRADAAKENLDIAIVQLDVTDPDSVTRAIDHAVRESGRIDVLVNNAGIGTAGPLEDFTDEDIETVFETNFFGAVRTTRAVLPTMRSQRSGTIIMMSSISGLRTFNFMSIYSASKFALEAASNGLRYELRPFGIRVVLIEPGNYRTRIGPNMRYPHRLRLTYRDTCDPLYAAMMAKQAQPSTPNFPLGDAHDIAKLAADIAQAEAPKARYLIGKDAEYWMEMGDDEFEQRLGESMTP
jgi:NAD(P)-dependent dehydrogenase (short-subunit alcohol dehydrogenase family)